ncbi:MAG: metallophosphoesterase [Gammaproteobacteria bacterium]|nr:metallophosphoesterase [Gammaproteobacteria bacterium]
MSEVSATNPNRKRWRRYATRTFVLTVLYFLVLVYPVVRLLGLVIPDWQPGTLELLAIFVLPIALRASYERFPSALTRVLAATALTWLGISFQLFAMMLPFELINLALPLPAQPAGFVLLAAIIALSVVGFINAQMLHVKTIRVPAPAAVQGRTLVQISDVHIGSRSPKLLARIVERSNALQADYVMITGDLIDFAGISRQELEPLARFNAPAYFAIGNHERYVDLNAIDERLRALGIHVLRNATATAGPFQFIGIDDVDAVAGVATSLARVPLSREHYGVLLYHRPDGFEAAARAAIPLTLAGHTHAGQIIPFNFIVKQVFPRMRGLHELNGSRLYVSPGTGTWGPILRIGSRCEITRIEFVAE